LYLCGIFLWEFKIIRVLCNYLSLSHASVEGGRERLKHVGGLPHIVIILSNYSAVVGVYMVNFLGVYGFRDLVQQLAAKKFY
jgi:hypothetical protein